MYYLLKVEGWSSWRKIGFEGNFRFVGWWMMAAGRFSGKSFHSCQKYLNFNAYQQTTFKDRQIGLKLETTAFPWIKPLGTRF